MSNNYDVSVLIPSRCEMFLKNTVDDLLKNSKANTEIIVGLDGQWANPLLDLHPNVNVIYVPEAIGQRAMTNICAKLAKGKYLVKCDAHCAFDEGWDVKMLEAFKQSGDNVVMVPIMRNLWSFSWKCQKCGKKWYQGPTPKQCQETNYKGTGQPCTSVKFHRKMMWVSKTNPQSKSYCFDSEPHFQYFGEWTKRDEYKEQLKTGLTETMSLQGSFFMCTREKYWELEICDEFFGSWGSQGIEVSLKFWLSGGKVLVNHNTYYAHMFRTQGGDFSFPYPQRESKVQEAKKKAKDLFFNNKWDKAILPLSYVVEKFWPVKGWDENSLNSLKLLEKEKNANRSIY